MQHFIKINCIVVMLFCSTIMVSQEKNVYYNVPSQKEIKTYIKSSITNTSKQKQALKSNHFNWYKDLFENRIEVDYKIGIASHYPSLSSKLKITKPLYRIQANNTIDNLNLLDYNINLYASTTQYFSLAENIILVIRPQEHFRN